MNKLFIKSVKINSVNGQNIPVKEFSDGFNLVCGDNEAGKSTLMKFLKYSFFSPKDLNGDIIAYKNDTEYQIKIEGKKSKSNERIKILSPLNTNINEFLEGIDQNFYQKAFTINLDDIQNIDNDLFNLIQDHNAPALCEQKTKLNDEIRKFLTDKNKINKTLKEILDSINEKENKIRELQNKEEEYYSISTQIISIGKELKNLQAGIENKQIILKNEENKNQIAVLLDEETRLKKEFNQKLYENKSVFYNLSQSTELILGNLEKCNRLKLSDTKSQIEKLIADIKLNYNTDIDKEIIKNIEVSKTIEEKIRETIEIIEKENNKIELNKNNKQNIEKRINELEQELKELTEKINSLNISNIDNYKFAYEELKNGINNLTDNSEKETFLQNIPILCTTLTTLVLLIVGGINFKSQLGIGLIILGIIFAILIFILNNKKNINSNTQIYNYLEKYILELNNNKSFIKSITTLNKISSDSENKIKEYKNIDNEIIRKQQDLNNNKEDLNKINNEIEKLEQKLDSLSAEQAELTTFNNQLFPPKTYIELIENIRELKSLIDKLNSEEEQIKSLDKGYENYKFELISFLNNCELDININPITLREKIKEIQETIEINDKKKNTLENIEQQKKELEDKFNKIKTDDLYPDKTLEELNEYESKQIETQAQLKQEKKALEEFEGLTALRNEINIEKERLKDLAQEIYTKKLALNIIEHAEKQQRSIEPNLLCAEKLLQTITNGKYISANYATETITSKDGEIKTTDQLSRGTLEQVYLAFRLGYAQNYGKDGSKYHLPLVIDDAFVNFDKTRLKLVLEALKEFAKTNQVIFFTCHKDYVTSLTEGYNLVEI